MIPVDPGGGHEADLLRLHSAEYVRAVKATSEGSSVVNPDEFGFGPGDNPIFPGMFEAALSYVAGSVKAARSVNEGQRIAFNIAGGLHHARRSNVSGFCIFNDPAIAVSVLREAHDRVAYVDIDVHHGCGVQWMWYDDRTVLTCSIHQDGRTLYPGSGAVGEHGAAFTSVNVPLAPGTTGDVWLWAFENGILAALERFQPQAIVLQMGTDSHFKDPLAQIENTAQQWLSAVRLVRDFGVPIVALGGGGYEPTVVPRMWGAAVLTLLGRELPPFPQDLSFQWEITDWLDPYETLGVGKGHAARVIEELNKMVLPSVPR